MRRLAGLVLIVTFAFTGTAWANDVGYDYFDALFSSGSPNDAEAALDVAAPNSPAYAYAVHQIGVMRAELASGNIRPTKVTHAGENVRACAKNLAGQDCAVFGKFKTRKGRLVTFSYIDGKQTRKLRAPVLGDGQETIIEGVRIRLVSYFQAKDALVVNVELLNESGAERDLYASETTYQPPEGPAVQAQGIGLSSQLQPGVGGALTLGFPGRHEPGGTVTFQVNTGPPDYRDVSGALMLPQA